ncbi:MAG: biotin/lipoyl-containing protein [Rubrivivax sp.]|nr:biotin/lipoyl-containing protein [Rubrivivax sp.]
MHARYLIDGTAHDVVATRGNDGSVQLRRGQRSLSVSREALPDGRSRTVHLAAGADAVYVHADGLGAVEVERQTLSHATGGAAGRASNLLSAPMPGVVIAVHVAAGDPVHAGQALMVIESMKLETTLVAPRDARVKTVHHAAGTSFALKAALITLEDA